MRAGGERPWVRVALALPAEALGRAEAALELLGAQAVTVVPEERDAVLEPQPGETPLGERVRLEALFPPGTEAGALRARVATGLGLDPAAVALEPVPATGWERAWMADFRPMRFGRRLWVVPSHAAPPEADAVNLRLDPGLAFGTGTHPTTALCLEWLDARPPRGLRVLDYGCGSGILAVAAALLGAEAVDAVDIEPQALEATRANAERNGVAARLRTFAPGALPPGRYDVVIANILARPLVELASTLTRRLAPGGTLVLAGMLADQAGAVARAYTPALTLGRAGERDGWVLLAGRMR